MASLAWWLGSKAFCRGFPLALAADMLYDTLDEC